MKAIEASFAAKEFVREVLIQSGLLDGITVEDPKSETKVMFWFVHNTLESASNKEAYVIYNVSSTEPFASGDGECFIRKVFVSMDIYSRKRDNQELLETIEAKFAEKKVPSFEISQPIDYNTSSKLYKYSIIIKLTVSDTPEEPAE